MRLSRTAKIVTCFGAFGVLATVSTAFFLTKPNPQNVAKIAESYGIPTKPNDLYAGFSVPNDANAYGDIVEFATAYEKIPQKEKRKLDDFAKQLISVSESEAKRAATDLLAYTDQYQPVIRRVLAKGKFQYKKDFKDPANVSFPELATIKFMAKVKSQRAIAFATLKQNDQAVAELNEAVTISNLLHNELFLISPLVVIATQQIVRVNMLQVALLSQDAATIEVCKKLEDAFREPNLKQALRGDAFGHFAAVSDPTGETMLMFSGAEAPSELKLLLKTQGMWEGKLMTRIGEWYRETANARSLPEIRKATDDFETWAKGSAPECRVAQYFLPVYAQFFDAFERRNHSGFLAKIGYEFARTKQIPDPLTIRDPYTGAHPVLKETPSGWALLFAGKDGVISGNLVEKDGMLTVREDYALVYDRKGLRLTGS